MFLPLQAIIISRGFYVYAILDATVTMEIILEEIIWIAPPLAIFLCCSHNLRFHCSLAKAKINWKIWAQYIFPEQDLLKKHVRFCKKLGDWLCAFLFPYSTLSSCVHAVVALLYPFSWQHTFIPVLPTSMVDIVCCPTPFLVGILSSSLPKLKELPVEEVLDYLLSLTPSYAVVTRLVCCNTILCQVCTTRAWLCTHLN